MLRQAIMTDRRPMDHIADDPRTTPARPDLAAAHLRPICKAARYVEGVRWRAVSGATALRGAPDCSAPQLTEILHGERFMVYEDRGGWFWGQAELDGYVGYAERTAFGPDGPPPTHMVDSLFAHLYSEPTGRSSTTALLPKTARLTLAERSACGRYRRVAGGGDYIFDEHVRAIDIADTDPAGIAERFLGAPYLWGGKTAGGIDCSGLVQIAFLSCGRVLPRDSDQQLHACRSGFGREIARADARRGDIAFFPGHVGIMRDADTLLHANATHMAVSADPLDAVIARIAKEQIKPLIGLYRPCAASDSV